MEKVSEVSTRIIYDGRDISQDVSPYLISLEYADKTEKEVDEVQLEFEDRERRWRDPWYPGKGDTLEVYIRVGDQELFCGVFDIDEIEIAGPPDICRVRGLAAGIKGKIRTRRSYAHENKTLRQIALTVAQRNGLQLIGNIQDVHIKRATQNRETDLQFLQRLSSQYGYVMNVRGDKLIFTTIFELEKGAPVTQVDRLDLISFSIKDKTAGSATDAEVKYHDPKTNEVIASLYNAKTLQNDDGFGYTEITAGDTITIKTKAETPQQADLKARTALYRANSKLQEGTITLPGNTLLVAGVNFQLTGLGKLSGTYHITESQHRVDRTGGYTTTLQIKRVGLVSPQQKQSTKAQQAPAPPRVYPLQQELTGKWSIDKYVNVRP